MKTSDAIARVAYVIDGLALIPAAYLMVPELIEAALALKKQLREPDGDTIAGVLLCSLMALAVCFLVSSWIILTAELKEERAEKEARVERAKFEHEQVQAHSDSR